MHGFSVIHVRDSVISGLTPAKVLAFLSHACRETLSAFASPERTAILRLCLAARAAEQDPGVTPEPLCLVSALALARAWTRCASRRAVLQIFLLAPGAVGALGSGSGAPTGPGGDI